MASYMPVSEILNVGKIFLWNIWDILVCTLPLYVCMRVCAPCTPNQCCLFCMFSQSCVMCTLTRLCGHSSFPNVYMNS